MTQKFTVLFDLDGTLIDTAPDLMNAHNHVMQKFGYETKSTDEIRNLVGKGAASMIGRSLWNQARKELKKIDDEKIKSIPEQDVDRTSAEGKASSVQFIHFKFNDEQIRKFKSNSLPIEVGIDHDEYSHSTKLNEATVKSLSADFN